MMKNQKLRWNITVVSSFCSPSYIPNVYHCMGERENRIILCTKTSKTAISETFVQENRCMCTFKLYDKYKSDTFNPLLSFMTVFTSISYNNYPKMKCHDFTNMLCLRTHFYIYFRFVSELLESIIKSHCSDSTKSLFDPLICFRSFGNTHCW